MKIAASNLALPPGDHRRLLPLLAEMGVGGLEIAPAHTWRNMDSAAVEGYRRCVENSGLAVVGLHGLLDGRPDLGLFKDAGTRERTADFLLHLAAVCRDIGGKTLILGNRWRGDGREIDAWVELRGFLDRLLPRIEPWG